MLIIKQYGVKLKRLQLKDIELVRYWRNQEHVVKNMEFKKQISSEEQLKWFQSINNPWNYYFMIEFEGKDIGVINVKNVDLNSDSGEGGIFIGDLTGNNSIAATLSSLCLLNFSFGVLKLTSKSIIKVLKFNKQAIEYNRILGYKLVASEGDFQFYELSEENYLNSSTDLNKAAAILSGKPELIFDCKISSIPLSRPLKLKMGRPCFGF